MKITRAMLHVRYWPTWVGLGFMRVLAVLPYRVQYALGAGIGALLYRLPSAFKRVARRNLDLCLPALTEAERERILHGHFKSLGIGLFETARSWWGRAPRILGITRVTGWEHLERALARGHGAILLSAHFTTLEIGAAAICYRTPTNIMYRPTNNLVLEAFLAHHRSRNTKRAIPRDDIRTLIKALKDNEIVWYAPDQAYRKKGAQMVPFFGVPAATNTATSRLARMTGAAVLPYFPERLPGTQGYCMHILPALEHFPSDDAAHDALRFNQLIEAHIQRVPEQYLWIHKRFKGLSADYPDHYAKRLAARG
jgi:Kdo2-lipid IVA lauroyltransferase/acyltransferase